MGMRRAISIHDPFRSTRTIKFTQFPRTSAPSVFQEAVSFAFVITVVRRVFVFQRTQKTRSIGGTKNVLLSVTGVQSPFVETYL